ncbi:MAG: pyridoxamine 5'-phosphate oxidase family protein [Thermodesulfovibrionales bacterium]
MLNTLPNKVSKGNIDVLERLRFLNQKQLHAVLATVSDGQPYPSLVAYALTDDMKAIVFATPKQTRKYKNILKNKFVSFLIDNRTNTKKDYTSAESITILGKACLVKRGKKWAELGQILKKKHPLLTEFIESKETVLICVKIIRCIHVTKFQKVSECSNENLGSKLSSNMPY